MVQNNDKLRHNRSCIERGPTFKYLILSSTESNSMINNNHLVVPDPDTTTNRNGLDRSDESSKLIDPWN